MIYGERIKQAREYKGLTQIELANRIGVKQAAISQIETSEFIPSPDILKAISKETGFMAYFFEREPISFPLGSLKYRAKRSFTAKEETRAYQYTKILYEQVKIMAEKIQPPRILIPQLLNEKPKIAAQVTRDIFGLSPDEPIKNIINLLEKSGVYVFMLPLILPNIDAFSLWIDERPIIAISSGKPMDRMRLSIAHELGHLVIHRGGPKNSIKDMETEANEFAGEFLMPQKAMTDEISLPLTLTIVARLKIRWGVSMQALIYRARSLKIITDRQAKYLFTQISAHGWKGKEPSNLDIKPETPQLFRKMIEGLYKDPSEYAFNMGISIENATELYVYA